jgi:hypothetical protein
MRQIDRVYVERIAKIIGQGSAAAKALADADKHDGPVIFYLASGSFIVEKHPHD